MTTTTEIECRATAAISSSSVDMIKSDIEGAELDAVFEIHFPVKFKKIAEGSDPHASIWRISKK